MIGMQKMRPILISYRILIPRRQQQHRRRGRTGKTIRPKQIFLPLHHLISQFPPHHLQPPLRLPQRQPAPPRKIRNRRRPPTHKIPPRQLPQSRITRKIQTSLNQQPIRKLFAPPGTTTNQPVQLGIHHQHTHPHIISIDLRATKKHRQFRTRKFMRIRQRLGQNLLTLQQHRLVDPQLPMHRQSTCTHPRPRQPHHPPNILRQHKMPGRPQDMRPQDPTRIKIRPDRGVSRRNQSQPHPPLPHRKILRLHTPHPPHHLLRRRKSGSSQPLAHQPPQNNCFTCHNHQNIPHWEHPTGQHRCPSDHPHRNHQSQNHTPCLLNHQKEPSYNAGPSRH